MTFMNNILKEVLIDIIPTQQELALINNVVIQLRSLLDEKVRQWGINFTRIESQGSTGIKQTQLKK